MEMSFLGTEPYLDAIAVNAAALVDAAEVAGLDAPVPSCPDWVVADLLAHIGQVHRWAAANTTRDADAEFWSSREIDAPAAPARADWVREGATALVTALDLDPETPAWTFGDFPSLVGFWQRRQAHETVMHRVDAQLAAGAVDAIDPTLAADGIDELLWLLPLRTWVQPDPTRTGTAHLHCTDVEGEWLLDFTPEGMRTERVHAKGDVAVRGTASDLLMWSSGRGSVEPLEVFGDDAQRQMLRDALTF
jgi:uncharacterized protein (TIGR03083 family)